MGEKQWRKDFVQKGAQDDRTTSIELNTQPHAEVKYNAITIM